MEVGTLFYGLLQGRNLILISVLHFYQNNHSFFSVWICSHIWIPKSQRLASTEQMFGTPYYSGLLIEQDMACNRRSCNGRIKFRLDVNRAPSAARLVFPLNVILYFDIANVTYFTSIIAILIILMMKMKVYMKTFLQLNVLAIIKCEKSHLEYTKMKGKP